MGRFLVRMGAIGLLFASSFPSTAARSRPLGDAPGRINFIFQTLKLSRTFQQLESRVIHAGWYLDEEAREYCTVEIGDNLEDHFSRSDTLRIFWDGTIDLMYYDSALEIAWKREYSPGSK